MCPIHIPKIGRTDQARVYLCFRASWALMVYDFHTEKWTRLASASSVSDLNWTRQSDANCFEDVLAPGGPGTFRLQPGDRRLEKVASLRREPP